MYDIRPFAPLYGPNAGNGAGSFIASLTIAATNASATSGALPGNATGGGDINQIQVANKTSAWAHVNVSRTTDEIVAATVAAGYPVAPGGVAIITVNSEVAVVSVILDAAPTGSTSVVFTRGAGT